MSSLRFTTKSKLTAAQKLSSVICGHVTDFKPMQVVSVTINSLLPPLTLKARAVSIPCKLIRLQGCHLASIYHHQCMSFSRVDVVATSAWCSMMTLFEQAVRRLRRSRAQCFLCPYIICAFACRSERYELEPSSHFGYIRGCASTCATPVISDHHRRHLHQACKLRV